MARENRVKVGFFSLTTSSPTGDDGPYLTWHQLDHMPEQYQLAGMVLGQRWRSTPACRRARAAEVGDWGSVEHAVCYLMGEPVDETVDDFLALGRELAEAGRYPQVMPSHYRGGLRLLEASAAPRVLVSGSVVPFRPHLGVYLVVEAPGGDDGRTATDGGPALGRLPEATTGALLEVPGVAGVWTFGTAPDLRRRMFSPGALRVTVCYLDDDPVAVADRLGTDLEGLFGSTPTQRLLAAPFEAVVKWDWGPSSLGGRPKE